MAAAARVPAAYYYNPPLPRGHVHYMPPQTVSTAQKRWPIQVGAVHHEVELDPHGTLRFSVLDPNAGSNVNWNTLSSMFQRGMVPLAEYLHCQLNSGGSLGHFFDLSEMELLSVSCPAFPDWNRAASSRADKLREEAHELIERADEMDAAAASSSSSSATTSPPRDSAGEHGVITATSMAAGLSAASAPSALSSTAAPPCRVVLFCTRGSLGAYILGEMLAVLDACHVEGRLDKDHPESQVILEDIPLEDPPSVWLNRRRWIITIPSVIPRAGQETQWANGKPKTQAELNAQI